MFRRIQSWLRRLWPVVSEEERAIRRELMFHLDRLTEELQSRGMSRRAARREALKRFGRVGHVEDEVANENGIGEKYEGDRKMRSAWNDAFQDVRYGLRMLRKNPGFTAVSVLTLALGIGANTAIFSVVNAVLLEPLPYPDPEQLAIVWQEHRAANLSRVPSSAIQFRALRENSERFQDLGGIWATTGTLTGDGDPEQVKVGMVTSNFLDVLGVPPAFGRFFLPTEEAAGRPVAVILSHGLWQRRYGADREIVGRTVRFQGIAVNVVGVMPDGYRMPFPAGSNIPPDIQLWTPFATDIYAAPPRLYYLRILGRLKAGATASEADAEAARIASDLRDDFAEYFQVDANLTAFPLHAEFVQHVRPALLALFAGVGLVLLIACVNVANLLLARASGRRKEMVLRSALGAGRGRIVRQLGTESLVLAAAGGAAGVGLAYLLSNGLRAMLPDDLVVIAESRVSLNVLGFALLTTVACGLLFGLAPILRAGRINLMEVLRQGQRDSRGGSRGWLSSSLVVGEIALGFVLLMGAGLVTRTFWNLLSVDPGFRTDNVLTFEIGLPEARYPTDATRTAFYQQLRDRLGEQSEVEAVGAISHLPLDDFPNWYDAYAPEGQELNGSSPSADHRATAAGYFEAIGASLVAGRFFDRGDEDAGRNVIVIDEVLARRTWPGEDAVGKRLTVSFMREGNFEDDWAEIVGVIRHIHHHGLDVEVRGQVYIPYPLSARRHQSFVLRTSGDPRTLIGPVRSEVAKLDPNLAVSKILPMSSFLERSTARRRFTMVLGIFFGALAVVLATVGIFGVIAHSVESRRSEFGIRMAIGAQPGGLLWLVLREGLSLAGIGVGLGAVGAWLVTPYLGALVFGVDPLDLVTQITVAALLVAVAAAGCLTPAVRAARVDPMVALRYE